MSILIDDMANYQLIKLQIDSCTTDESIKKYIEKRYVHYYEYAAYHCTRAGIMDESYDLLNEVLLSLLQMDYCKMNKLYEAKKIQKGVEYRELDFFILKAIRLNAHSPQAPFRWKFFMKGIKSNVKYERLKIIDEEDDSEDKSKTILTHFRLVRYVFNGLDLTDFERRVFDHAFIQGEPISQWPGPEIKKHSYIAYKLVIGAIHWILFRQKLTTKRPMRGP